MNKKGFTLLELLIVITIISVLSVILIVALNPAETLRKARDTQRLSDLASLKTALGVYITSKSSPLLDNVDNNTCNNGTGSATTWVSAQTSDASIYSSAAVVDTDGDSGDFAIDGTGWIKVNLGSIAGGSPISNLPIDPSTNNETSVGASVTDTTLVYTFVCDEDDITFEINAVLESAAFGPASTDDDKSEKDGGNSDALYEVGTKLNIVSGR